MIYGKYGIIGIGSAVPGTILDNEELSVMVNTSNEWIMSHVGIKTRHIAGPDEFSTDLMIKPARFALASAGLSIDDIDVIFVTTSYPDQLVPLPSDDFARKIGAKNTLLAIDISAACAGFCWAIASVVEHLDTHPLCNTVLLVSGDATSKHVDYTDRNTCVLFGDGGGAVVIQRQIKISIFGVERYSDRAGYECLSAEAGGTMHFGPKGGSPMLKEIVGKTPALLEGFCHDLNFELKEIDHLVPHQLNSVIVNSLEEKLIKRGLRPGVLFSDNIANYGNCSGSSVPMALDTLYRQKRLKYNDTVVLATWAAGMKFSFVALRWIMF